VRWLPGIDPWSFNAFRGLGLALSMALWIAHALRTRESGDGAPKPAQALLLSAGFFALGSSLYIFR
jgi:hypothetical protein